MKNRTVFENVNEDNFTDYLKKQFTGEIPEAKYVHKDKSSTIIKLGDNGIATMTLHSKSKSDCNKMEILFYDNVVKPKNRDIVLNAGYQIATELVVAANKKIDVPPKHDGATVNRPTRK